MTTLDSYYAAYGLNTMPMFALVIGAIVVLGIIAKLKINPFTFPIKLLIATGIIVGIVVLYKRHTSVLKEAEQRERDARAKLDDINERIARKARA